LRSGRGAALAALAAAHLACASFPRYPVEGERALLGEVTVPDGTVRLDATFDLYLNGKVRPGMDGQTDYYLGKVAKVYREPGLFDRIAEPRDRPDLVISVRGRGLLEGSAAWQAASNLTLFLVPSTMRTGVEIDTVVREAETQRELGRSRVCGSLRQITSVVMFPAIFTNPSGGVEMGMIQGLTRKGLALALATEADRARSPALTAAAASACDGGDDGKRTRVVEKDGRGSWTGESAYRESVPCLERPGRRRYLNELGAKVRERWTPPPDRPGASPAAVSLWLAPDGSIIDLKPGAPDDPLAERTIVAVRAAAPFPPLEGPLLCLADEPMEVQFP
jgi:hypothetical protein